MNVGRRTFFKLAGMATAGSVTPGCKKEADRLVPYLLPDEQIVPGVADWYASVCGECPAGCGVLVRVMEGRAKKVEGNPSHPMNRGKLCAKGQASLQSLYNPDRLRHPCQREGPRGDARFVPLDWEEGLQRLAQALQSRRMPPLMVTRPLSGTLASLLSAFMESMGGRLYFCAPNAELPLHAAWRESMGSDSRPFYDLAHADYLLSFGAPFLEHWLSPVAMGIAFGHMRQGRKTVRGRYVHIEPRMSVTAANADQWLPIRPGTEGMLALGIGQRILDAPTSSGKEFDRFRMFYGSVRLDDVEGATGLSRDVIGRLAHDFMSARAPVAMGGGSACSQTNGTLSLIAINGLNALASSMGRESVARSVRRDESRRDSSIPWLTEQMVFKLVEKQEDAGAGPVLLLYGCNPLFTIPPSVPIKALFEQASSVVSFSSFLDESSEYADLLLPDRDPLESWGDHDAESTPRVMELSQPVVTPLYDTKQLGDTILDLSRRLGLGGMQAKTFYDLLRERWSTFLDDKPHDETDDWFEQAWIARLQEGGWWQEETSPRALPVKFVPSRGFEQARFVGEEREYPFVLHPYPSMALGHGEGANRPWLQELPDTLTTVVWGSWVEINPKTARDLGITQGDSVRVISPFGSLTASVVLFPGIRPEVVAMPLGQGHGSYGRYARNRGVNPAELLAPALDTMTGTLAAGATRVRIEQTGAKGRLVTLEWPAMDQSDLITITRQHKDVGLKTQH